MDKFDKCLLSLNQEFTNFITERVAKERDEKAEKLIGKIYDAIEEYKTNKELHSIRHYDKLVEAINDLLIYHEAKIYKKAFMEGISLPFLCYLEK